MKEKALSLEEKRKLQLSELEILLDFRNLCRTHGLEYYLTAGTLLGAARHKGFIPWDDDIDIAMPREDFDKLPTLCRNWLTDKYYYQCSETEKNFPYFFSKIRKHGTEVYEPHLDKIKMGKGQYIDIFPLDACPENDSFAKLFFKMIELLTCAYVGKVDETFVCRYKKWYAKRLYKLLSRLSLKNIQRARKMVTKIVSFAFDGQRLCTVGGAHGYPAETYDREWFDEKEQLLFEGELFDVPLGWNDVLTSMYGDYMKPVPINERDGHFILHR